MTWRINLWEKYKRNRMSIINIITGIMMVLITGFLIWIFASISHTNLVDICLDDNAKISYNWEYEILSNGIAEKTQPKYVDDYNQNFGGSEISAIKMERTMTEEVYAPEIKLPVNHVGIEAYLDGKILHSDFPNAKCGENGFLELKDEDFKHIIENEFSREIMAALPENYHGMKLTVITYFPPAGSVQDIRYVPTYPILTSGARQAAAYVIGAVPPTLTICIAALFMVILGVIFLLGVRSENTQWTVLLLILFYALLLINTLSDSILGAYSGITQYLKFGYLYLIYVSPLVCYVAIRLTGWRRNVLLTAGIIEFLYSISFCIYKIVLDDETYILRNGLTVFVLLGLTFVLSALEYQKHPAELKKYVNLRYGLITAVILVMVSIIESAEFESLGGYFTNIFSSIMNAKYKPISGLLATTLAIAVTIILIVEFVKKTLYDHKMISMLQTRSEQSMASYQIMKSASQSTHAAQHELKHHLLALTGMLKHNETDKALEYISAIGKTVDRLPTASYSDNMMVDMIVGTYLERAKANGISEEHYLSLPQQLGIEDRDLCVLLTNMLENAVEACMKIPQTATRYIHIQIWKNGKNLLIACKNSTNEKAVFDENGNYKSSKNDSKSHGYGIAAMREVAEKYDSIIKIDCMNNEFFVKTNLLLKEIHT